MCRFFAGMLFHHPIMQEYSYYWRIDADSLVTCPFPSNPFAKMRSASRKYGWLLQAMEEPAVAGQSLWDAVSEYIDLHLLKRHSLGDARER